MAERDDDRRIGKAWRNAAFAVGAVAVLVIGTRGVMSAIPGEALGDHDREALEACGRGEVKAVSQDGYRCGD